MRNLTLWCGITLVGLSAPLWAMQGEQAGLIRITCPLCHEHERIERTFLLTDTPDLLAQWVLNKIAPADVRWWALVHPFMSNLIEQVRDLTYFCAHWYAACTLPPVERRALGAQFLSCFERIARIWPGCVCTMGAHAHATHLDCLKKRLIDRPRVRIKLPATAVSIDTLEVAFLTYVCPAEGQLLSAHEEHLFKHYLDLAYPGWYKAVNLQDIKEALTQELRKMVAENPEAFKQLCRASGLAKYATFDSALFAKSAKKIKVPDDVRIKLDAACQELAQLILDAKYGVWLEGQETAAQARAKEREAYRSSLTSTAQPVKTGQERASVRALVLKMLGAELRSSVADDYAATFIGFQRIVNAVKKGPESIRASDDLAVFLAAQSNFADFQRFLNQPEELFSEQNPIRDEVARRWIRNAAARVFNRPLRSFLEAVLNADDAIDACVALAEKRPAKVVGKFGMGFLSILQLLSNERTKGVTITIQTAPMPDQYTPQPFPYQMTIKLARPFAEIDFSRDFDVRIEARPLPAGAELLARLKTQLRQGAAGEQLHGTLLYIEPNEGAFTQDEIDELVRYLHYLDFYEPVQMQLVVKDKNGTRAEYIGGLRAEPHINVELGPKRIAVLDGGMGISLYVALYKLFIPSSSTKKVTELRHERQKMRAQEPVRPVTFQEFKGKTPGDQLSHFIVTVNGVLVIDVDLSEQLRADKNRDLVLRMPPATQLTLARDELMIGYDPEGPDGLCPEEAYLRRIIRETVDVCIRTRKDTDLLQALFVGLKGWEDRSSNVYIKGRLTGFLRSYLNEKLTSAGVVAAPKEFMERFVRAQAIDLGCLPVGLSPELANYDYSSFEQKLVQWYTKTLATAVVGTESQIKKDAINNGLIKGMQVFFVSSASGLIGPDEVGHLGLKNVLFVSEAMLKQVLHLGPDKAKTVAANTIASLFIDRDFSSKKSFFEGLVVCNTTDGVRDCEDKILQEFMTHMRTHRTCGKICVDLFTKKYAFGSFGIDELGLYRIVSVNTPKFDAIRRSLSPDEMRVLNWAYQLGYKVLQQEDSDDYRMFLNLAGSHKLIKFTVDAAKLLDAAPMILGPADESLARDWLKKYAKTPLSGPVRILPIFSEEFYQNKGAYDNFVQEWNEPGARQTTYFSVPLSMLFYDTENELFYRRIVRPDQQLEAQQKERFRKIGKEVDTEEEWLRRFCREVFFPFVRTSDNFEVVPAYKVFNMHMFNVLSSFGFVLPEDVSDPSKIIMVGEDVVWPTTKSVEALGKTYLVLSEYASARLFDERLGELNRRHVSLPAQTQIEALGYERVLKVPIGDSIAKLNAEVEAGHVDYNFLRSHIEKAVQACTDPVSIYVKRMIGLWKKEGLHFVGLDGVRLSPEVLRSIKNEVAHFAAVDCPLRKNFNNFSLMNSLTPLLTIVSCMGDGARTLAVQTFQERVKSVLETYAQVPESFIPFAYGAEVSKVRAHVPLAEIRAEDAARFLNVLQSDAHDDGKTVRRICELTVDDLRGRCDRRLQQSDLATRQLFVPHLLFNTPLAVLTQLYTRLVVIDRTYALDVIKSIVEHARNDKELVFVVNMLLLDTNAKLFDLPEPQKRLKLCQAIGLLCSTFVPEKIDKDVIEDSFQRCRTCADEKQKIQHYDRLTIKGVLNEYLKGYLDPALLEETKLIINNELVFGAASVHLTENTVLNKANDLKARLPLTLKQLINAHVAGRGIKEMLDADKLAEAKEVIARSRADFDLGKITQSVEFGSEREPIVATLIECLQNSVDAARDFLDKITKNDQSAQQSYQARLVQLGTNDAAVQQLCSVEYALEVYQSDGSRGRVCLSLVDHVGFPSLAQLLTDFMLPDYSAKSPALGNVGDMGNGTFKMYQHASRVFVLTRTTKNPNLFYLLVIQPERNSESGLIEDLRIDCHDVSAWMLQYNPGFFGTSFKILFEEKDLMSITADVLYAKEFLFDCLNSVDVMLDVQHSLQLVLHQRGENIYLNKHRAQRLYEHCFGQLPPYLQGILQGRGRRTYEFGTPIFRFSLRPNMSMQSYLTTNGVPFRSLGAVLEEEDLLPPAFIAKLRYGYVVDLALNTYEPVQSRTHLKMSTEFKNELRRALLEAYFILGLKKASDEETAQQFLATHFTHIKSAVSEIDQLRLSTEKAIRFKQFYTSFVTGNAYGSYPSETDFFDFYAPISLPDNAPERSLHQFIERLCNDPFWIYRSLCSARDACFARADVELKSAITQLKSKYPQKMGATNITDDEKKEVVAQLARICDRLKSEWSLRREAEIRGWQTAMSNYFGAGALLKNIERNDLSMTKYVLIPWATKKLMQITLELSKPEELIQGQPRFKTEREVAQELLRSQAVMKDLGIFHGASGGEQDAILGRLQQYNIQPFIDGLLRSYVRTFFSVVTGLQQKDPVKMSYCYTDSKSNTLGGFGGRDLKINIGKLSPFELVDLGMHIVWLNEGKIEDDGMVKSLSAYTKLFDPVPFEVGTVLHELEHARRGVACSEGAHVEGIDAHGHEVNYNACARSWAEFAIGKGLFNQWVKEFAEFVHSNDDLFSGLKTACEAKNNEGLTDLVNASEALHMPVDEIHKRLGFPER